MTITEKVLPSSCAFNMIFSTTDDLNPTSVVHDMVNLYIFDVPGISQYYIAVLDFAPSKVLDNFIRDNDSVSNVFIDFAVECSFGLKGRSRYVPKG